jgi:imidazolonepropionase
VTLRLIEGGRGEGPTPGLLVHGPAEIATMAGGLRRGASQGDAALLSSGGTGEDDGDNGLVIASWEGRFVAVGTARDVERSLDAQGYPLARFARLDARGGLVTPGLVDPHTHLLFAGTREAELLLRQRGAKYLDILAAGGGILSTVAATREASSDALQAHGRRWLDEMLAHGVTTVEAKSGYGLDVATELRLLEVADRLGREGPVDVVPSFLGAHAVPREFRMQTDGTEAYTRHVIEQQLPAVAAAGHAVFCDVFCEEGVFSVDQSRRILVAGRSMGLELRLHADEVHPSGGAELAAELGALSADHLAAPSEAGIEALAAAAERDRPVVATLLPATTWFLMSDHYAPARTLIERGVPVALASDFNPGTSPTSNLALVMTVACLALRLTPAEALAAVTVNAAHALGLGEEIGSIEAGRAADLVIWRVPRVDQVPYWPGADLVRTVVKRGRIVFERG